MDKNLTCSENPGNSALEGWLATREVLRNEKWSVLIIALLGTHHTMRFGELSRTKGISERMLTLSLRQLERDGLLTRTIRSTIPLHVDYELTELGKSLVVPVMELFAWSTKNGHQIKRAREKYDRKAGADGLNLET